MVILFISVRYENVLGVVSCPKCKRVCGHLDNKELISTDAMVKKIKECVAAKKDDNFKIIARSDAKSVEGIDKMI